MKAKVEIYCTPFCPYCVRAKRMLDGKGVKYREIRVDQSRKEMKIMMQRSQRETVPQIFIDDFHVGGYDDMAELEAHGKLDRLLRGNP